MENEATAKEAAMFKTIRRGTKRFDRILDAAADIVSYALDNGFVGTAFENSEGGREWLRRQLRTFRFAKLKDLGNGKYQVSVHSNLWYKFTAA